MIRTLQDFNPGREQDAWPTIRGFKYQIQLTILRWLELADQDILYLECGEDIDRVLRLPDAVGMQRELEQVKARGRNMTLRSPEALSALANFAAHLKANPGLSLRFRFTTTASPGRERISPLGKRTRALDAWAALQDRTTWTTEDDTVLTKLGELILGATCPERCQPGAWESLLEIVRGTGTVPFAMFVTRFEWSCGSTTPDDLEAILLARMGERPGDTGADDPSRKQRCDQLTSYVLDILSREGEKKLTRRLLADVLSRPTLTEHDRARLKLLESQSASQSATLDVLQATLQRIESSGAVPLLFGEAASELRAVSLSQVLPEPPPVVKVLVRRASTVDDVSAKLGKCSWLAIHGDYGTGKSHLGFLVAERHGGIVLGVSLRGLTAAVAESGLAALLASPATLAAIKSSAPGVVLLDDLPESEPQSRLEVTLAVFAKAVGSTGRSIISTGRRPPSGTLSATLDGELFTLPNPTFSDEDAAELFRAHGVKEATLTTQRVASMNAVCGGHPMLLTALARHLLTRPENPDQALIEVLLASKHRTELDLQTSRAILGTVESEACRNLLYRLASIGTALGIDEIRSIAEVSPALPEPTACIARLDGLWLRRTSKSLYEVSPLTTPLGREVPATVNKAVHSRAARIVFARRTLSIPEFITGIMSLLVAGEHQHAASHLLYGCVKWPLKKKGYGDLGVLFLFPPDKDHGLDPVSELGIRGVQVVTAAIKSQDPGPYLARIESMLADLSPQTVAGATLAGSFILTSSLNIPAPVACYGASLIERFRDAPPMPMGPPSSKQELNNSHLLLPTACIHTWDDLDEYVALLASLSEARRREVASMPELRQGMSIIVTRPLFNNLELTPGAFERLRMVEERGYSLGIPMLSAYAAAGRLVVLGEYERDVDRMLAEAERARGRLSGSPAAISVIEATVGLQLFLNQRFEESLKHLDMGLADPTHIVGLERGNRLVDALTAAWQSGEDAGPYADQLAEMLSGKEFAVPEVLCQMHVQIALVRWKQNRWNEAFDHFERSVVHFLDLEDSTRTRQLGTGLAHSLSHFAAIVETGQPPPKAADGGLYAESEPRMFSGTNEAMAGMWRVRQGPAMLRWLLGRLAAYLGLEDAAATWFDRAQEAAIGAKSPVLLSLLAPRAVISAVRRGAWADALEAAVICGHARLCADAHKEEIDTLVDDSVSFDPLEAPATPELRSRSEETALWVISRVLVSELAPYPSSPNTYSSSLEALAKEVERLSRSSQLVAAWHALARIVRLLAATDLTDQQHKDALQETDDRGAEYARFVAHGLLNLRADARLQQAAPSQASVLRRLENEANSLGFKLEYYSEAVSHYWPSAVARTPFRFSAPRDVRRLLEEAAPMMPTMRAKTILRAVVTSLSAPVPTDVREWLKQTG